MANNRMPRINTQKIVLIAIVAAAAAVAASSFYSVDATEQAVITRFGRYETTVGPGLHLRLPFGIDRNYNIPVKVVQTEQFGFATVKAGRNNEYRNNIEGESTMLTGDLNIVNVEWIIQYRIVDPKAWQFNVQERRQTIRDISRSVINTLVGDRAILDVMGEERASIEAKSQEQMNDWFKRLELGISVIAVKLQNIVPPPGVQASFEDVNKAVQDMNRLVNEGKEAYNSQIPKAQGEAEREVQVALGYAAERVNQAKGDVARFNSVLAEYRRAPAVTRERIYLETMAQVFGDGNGAQLIDGELGNILPVKTLTGGNAAGGQ